jgi:transcriptional regulator with XRE-family HTH domain
MNMSVRATTREERPARSWTVTLDGTRLRELRYERGLSQAELGRLAGISKATVVRLERQARMCCRGRTLARLAAALDEKPASSGLLLPDTEC